MTDEAWNSIKDQLKKRYPPEEAATWLKKNILAMTCRGKPSTIIFIFFFHLKGELKKPALKELRLRGKGRNGSKAGAGRGGNPGNDPYRHPSGGNKRP
jgi:hypothetical protein